MHLAYGIGFMWGVLCGAQVSGAEQVSTKDVMMDSKSH
jgi:hypothetical protein